MRSEQKQFDWNRAAQFKAIQAMRFPPIKGVSGHALKVTLWTMHTWGGLDGKVFPKLEEIQENTHFRCKRTLQRCIKALTQLGVLTTFEERTPLGHKRVGWLIDWQRIFSDEPLTAPPVETPAEPGPLAPSVSAPCPSPEAGRAVLLAAGNSSATEDHFAVEPGDMVSEPGDMVSEPGDMVSLHTLYEHSLEHSMELLPPLAPRGGEVEDSGIGSGTLTLATVVESVTGQRRSRELSADSRQPTAWSVIESRLAQAGMNSRSCLRDARKSGVTPAEVGHLIDWWEARREWWDTANAVGILFVRIKGAYPGQPVEDNWREAVPWRKERWQRQRSEVRGQRSGESQQSAISNQPTADSLQPWKAKVLELEQQGRKQDLLDLAERAGPFVANWFRKHGITKTTLGPLARALQESD